MSTGIVATAIILIIGYVIVSRIIGLAFRLAVPLAVLAILAGAGLFSNLLPDRGAERFPGSRAGAYEDFRGGEPDARGGIGDLRLRDVSAMATDTVRAVLQGGLAFLDRLTGTDTATAPGSPERAFDRRGAPRDFAPDPFEDSDPQEFYRRR